MIGTKTVMTRDQTCGRGRGGWPVLSPPPDPAGGKALRPAVLARLRQAVARIEGGTATALPRPSGDGDARWRAAGAPAKDDAPRDMPAPGPRLTLGIDDIDTRLPGGGLAAAGVHEIAAAAPGDVAAASGFAAALMARRLTRLPPEDTRPVLWCRHGRAVAEYGRLYGPGLAAFGLAGERLLSLSLARPRAILWTLEEALKSTALSGVIADMTADALDLTASRRLMLAARRAGVPCLMVFAHPLTGATAAFTRWRIAPHASGPPAFDAAAPGLAAWTLTLERSRAGRPGQWTVEWHHATHRFALVPALRHRPLRLDEAPRTRAVAGG
jgi:protein ImuA